MNISNLYTYAHKIFFAKQKNKIVPVSKVTTFILYVCDNIETNGHTHTRTREQKTNGGG
jgi:hypothetical protein